MSARAKGPRLWFRKARRDDSGRIVKQGRWWIKDNGEHIATGCAEREVERARLALADYITEKYRPGRTEQPLNAIPIADVLSVYVDDSGQSGQKFDGRIKRLNAFWGNIKLSEVTPRKCKDYAELRGDGGARRDLQDLQAAINHHLKQNLHREIVSVTLPAKGAPRDRHLTRQEAAKLLWVSWRARELQVHSSGAVITRKYPLRHLARFLLIGFYTGTRAGAIATASPERKEGRSFVDLERGIFYRLAIGKRATIKRQTPAPIPDRLLAHMRRWHRLGVIREHFVEFNGRPVKSVKTAFASAVAKAGIEHAYPHALRHTAATWMMQNGAPPWQAAGFLGMSEKVLLEVYGHHHPDFMQEAKTAITAKTPARKREAVVHSVVHAIERRVAGG